MRNEELDELHKYNKQKQIDLIYTNLRENLKRLKNNYKTINQFISAFLIRTNTCNETSCSYNNCDRDCQSCDKYNLALTHLSQKLQFIDELYKEDNKRIQEKINQRCKNQYTVKSIEYILGIKFEGNIEDKDEVKNFINDNLPKIFKIVNQE